MSQQWRVACENCGKKISDYLRMHSEIPRSDVSELEDKEIVEAVRERSAKAVRCNHCGTVRIVNG